MRSRWVFWGLFVAFLAIDQLSKFLTRTNLHEGQSFPLWPGIFELTLTYNKGIAFGQFQGAGVYLSPVAVLIAGGAAFYSFRHPKESLWVHSAMGLLASGALGNLYDRLAHHRVTDMFWVRAIDFPVFNVADACISVAAGILVVRWGMESFSKPAPKAVAPEPETESKTATEPGVN